MYLLYCYFHIENLNSLEIFLEISHLLKKFDFLIVKLKVYISRKCSLLQSCKVKMYNMIPLSKYVKALTIYNT